MQNPRYRKNHPRFYFDPRKSKFLQEGFSAESTLGLCLFFCMPVKSGMQNS
jgi:hypothetical protein